MAHVLLHPTQARFVDCREPFAAFAGGIGSGKSHVLCYNRLRAARPGRLYAMIAPTYPMLRDATIRSFMGLAEKLGVRVEFNRSESRAVLMRTGAEILFRSADNPESLRGPNLAGVDLDEASLMPRAVYDISIGRLRQGTEVGTLRAAFTPKGPTHWTYEVFATERPDTALFRAHTRDNIFNPAAFAETIARQYGDTQFARQELGGEFVSITGAWFPAEWFDRPGFWFRDWPTDLVLKVIALDPSTGGSDVSDFQAYVTAGLDSHGTIHLDADLNRESPTQMVARGIRLAREWHPIDALLVEDNATMGFIGPEVERQCREAGVLVPWQLVTQRANKLDRIRGLSGYLSRGQIRVRDTPGGRLLRAQLGDVPLGEYDDAPDAAATAIRHLELLTQGA